MRCSSQFIHCEGREGFDAWLAISVSACMISAAACYISFDLKEVCTRLHTNTNNSDFSSGVVRGCPLDCSLALLLVVRTTAPTRLFTRSLKEGVG